MRPFFAALAAALLAPPGGAADPAALAKGIDARVNAKLAAAGVPPGPPADDAAFLRRATLTLTGRVPTPAAVHAYLGDADPDKKRKLLDRLFASPAHATHLTAVWRGWLLPEAGASFELGILAPGLETWLRPRVRDNLPLDRLVTELLTAPVAPPRPAAMRAKADGDDEEDDEPEPGPARMTDSPLAFYVAKEGKPENLAASTARLFLGVQMDCAQCHNHPSGKWTRDQFWELAAFFAGLEPGGNAPYGGLQEVSDRRTLAVPNTGRTVRATFPDGTSPAWAPGLGGRAALARWLTAPKNPFFARAVANRAWALLFGVGLVDPVDDLSAENPPSHPELLDDLARAFTAGGADFRSLLTAIMLSDAYGRSSAGGAADPRLFARFPVQGLSPEQLYDSLTMIVGRDAPPKGKRGAMMPDANRRQFLDRFAQIGKRTETPTSLLQALTLMNGELVDAAADPRTSRAVSAAAGLPGLSDDERVNVLYLTAVGRPPSAAERGRAAQHLAGGPEGERRQRLGDLMWALLNGVEFRTNH